LKTGIVIRPLLALPDTNPNRNPDPHPLKNQTPDLLERSLITYPLNSSYNPITV